MSHAGIDRANDELKELLLLAKDAIADLAEWSVYNDDQYNEEITRLEETLEEIK